MAIGLFSHSGNLCGLDCYLIPNFNGGARPHGTAQHHQPPGWDVIEFEKSVQKKDDQQRANGQVQKNAEERLEE